jgi:periplasmic protein TonB
MFEESLLESAPHFPGARRTCSTAASLLLQAGFLAAFALAPLLASRAVPDFVPLAAPIWMPHLDNPAPQVERTASSGGTNVFVVSRTVAPPSRIPRLDRRVSTEEVAPVEIGNNRSVGSNAGISNVLGNGPGPALPDNPAAKHPPVSVLQEGVVLSRVQPIYPQLAITNRIQGTVHLNAVITSHGTLEELRVLSGLPLLARAAREAVAQWKFRPYVLNGKPIEVQTEVIVNFSLN